jgi:hypothetical protein
MAMALLSCGSRMRPRFLSVLFAVISSACSGLTRRRRRLENSPSSMPMRGGAVLHKPWDGRSVRGVKEWSAVSLLAFWNA